MGDETLGDKSVFLPILVTSQLCRHSCILCFTAISTDGTEMTQHPSQAVPASSTCVLLRLEQARTGPDCGVAK